jgi:hypothetical protein
MPSELVEASAANDNPPFAVLWCYRTLHAEGISRNRLFASLDDQQWPRWHCFDRGMLLRLRDEVP